MKSLKSLSDRDLVTRGACGEWIAWVRIQKSAKTGWASCQDPQLLFWLLEMVNPLTKEQAVKLACKFARQALPQFEVCYPDDNRPLLAIIAAEEWIKNQSSASAKSAALSAGYAASSAADAAWSVVDEAWGATDAAASAAWGAADAAWSAASSAASSAVYAASSAADAALSATWSAIDVSWGTARIAAWNVQCEIIREIVPCPFD